LSFSRSWINISENKSPPKKKALASYTALKKTSLRDENFEKYLGNIIIFIEFIYSFSPQSWFSGKWLKFES